MTPRPARMIPRPPSGVAALAFLALLIGGGLGALLAAAPRLDASGLLADKYLRHVVLFTVGQALASTLLSVGAALPVARALARRQGFAGRRLLLRLFGLPLVMPTLVAIFGIVAIYGQTGALNRMAATLGLPERQYLYGLTGILIAHVFFNMPLAVRLLLPAWASVPGETWRLASQLGMRSSHIFRLIEWPALKRVLPGAAGLVFMLCFTSFAPVLALGGGPAAATLEVAIYQSLRLDFDVGRAVALALVQVGLCAAFLGLGALAPAAPASPTLGRVQGRPDLEGRVGKTGDAAAILFAALFIALPLAAMLLAGLTGPLEVLADAALWRAILRSLAVALASAMLSLALGAALLATVRDLRLRRGRRRTAALMEVAGSLVLAVPPLVLGAGLFVLLSPVADVFAVGLVLVVLVNAATGLAYVLRVLGPQAMQVGEKYDRLCAELDLRGWNRLRLVEWPELRRPIGLAAALVAALSIGDLGAIALFGTEDTETLALLLYRRLGSYQMDAAAVTALALLALCLAVFSAIERGVGRDAA